MIRHYILSTLRLFNRNRLHTALNLTGITVGFYCVYLVGLFLANQYSFDRFHRDADRTYRIVQHILQDDGSVRKVAAVAPRIGPEMMLQFPEVADVIRLMIGNRLTVGNEPENRDYETAFLADINFFSFFDFPLAEGSPDVFGQAGNRVVLSQAAAEKYLGRDPATGKSLITTLFVADVAAVVEFPHHSHLSFGTAYPIPMWAANSGGFRSMEATNWTNNFFVTYVKLKPGADPRRLEQALSDMVSPHYPDDQPFAGRFELQALKDVHLHSADMEGAMNVNAGNMTYVRVFFMVGVLMVFVVGFNLANLSAAMFTRRLLELGVRKTLGASHGQLLVQFFLETALLCLCGVLVAVVLLDISIGYLNSLLETTLRFEAMSPTQWLLLSLGLVAAGMAAVVYPATQVYKLHIHQALQKMTVSGKKSTAMRRLMVGLQFVIAVGMIGATLLMYHQVNFMRDRDPGFKQSGLMTIDINSGAMRGQFEQIKAAYAAIPEVRAVSVSSRVPGEWKVFPMVEMRTPAGTAVQNTIYVGVDPDFLGTYDIRLAEGRNFLPGPADSASVLINRTAALSMGLENPVGATIRIPSSTIGGNQNALSEPLAVNVIGIVEDFQFESYRESLRPMILAHWNNPIIAIDYYTLRLESDDPQATLAKLAAITDQFDPNNPMEYHVLTDQLRRFFEDDHTMARLFVFVAVVMALIACLGLFAVASYTLQQRTKEVVIRKILGASFIDLQALLLGDYVRICLIASAFAIPATYLAMRPWLDQFAIRTAFPYWVFPLSAAIGLILALGTVLYLSTALTRSNPAEHLRND